MKIAHLAIASGRDKMIFKGEDNELQKLFGVSFDDVALLIEIGILQPGDFISYELRQTPTASKSVFTNGSMIMVVEKKENTPMVSIPIYLFTKIGGELLSLISININMNYLKEFAKFLRRHQVSIKYGHILDRTGSQIRHTNPLQEFDD